MITPELIDAIRINLTSQMAADRLLQQENSPASLLTALLLNVLQNKHSDISYAKNEAASRAVVTIRISFDLSDNS